MTGRHVGNEISETYADDGHLTNSRTIWILVNKTESDGVTLNPLGSNGSGVFLDSVRPCHDGDLLEQNANNKIDENGFVFSTAQSTLNVDISVDTLIRCWVR